ARNRSAGLDLVREGPDGTIRVLRRLRAPAAAALSLFPELDLEPELEPGPAVPDGHENQASAAPLPYVKMPAHHDVRAWGVALKRPHGALAAAAARGPQHLPDVLLTPGVGARAIEALAVVAEVVHGTPCRFSDPARFSLAHGGKDGHPFPVPLQ